MNKKALFTLFLVIFIDLLGFGIVIPILPYYAKSFGATGWIIGWLMACYSLLQFIVAPLWGRISDFYGRKIVLIASLFGEVVALLIMAYANDLFWLFIGRIFAGFFAANISTAYAFVSDITTEENRAKGMGILGAAFGLGFVFGPAIGGWLSQYSYSLPYEVTALIAFVNIFCAIFLLQEPTKKEDRLKNKTRRFRLSLLLLLKKNSKLKFPIFGFFLSTLALTQMEVIFALYMLKKFDLTAEKAGYLLAFVGLMMAIVQGGLIGRLSKKFSEINLTLAGAFIGLWGYFLYPAMSTLGLIMLCLTALAFAQGLLQPTLSSLCSKFAEKHEKGEAMGLFHSFSSLARIIGPLVAGWAYDSIAPGSPFIIGGFFLSFLGVMTFVLKQKVST